MARRFLETDTLFDHLRVLVRSVLGFAGLADCERSQVCQHAFVESIWLRGALSLPPRRCKPCRDWLSVSNGIWNRRGYLHACRLALSFAKAADPWSGRGGGVTRGHDTLDSESLGTHVNFNNNEVAASQHLDGTPTLLFQGFTTLRAIHFGEILSSVKAFRLSTLIRCLLLTTLPLRPGDIHEEPAAPPRRHPYRVSTDRKTPHLLPLHTWTRCHLHG